MTHSTSMPDGTGAPVLSGSGDTPEPAAAIAALRASEARYRSLVEASCQIVWRTGPRGEFVVENDAWAHFTGGEPGTPAPDLPANERWLASVHPEDRTGALARWRAALAAATPYEARYRLRRADGEWRAVVARGVPVRDEGGMVREWVGTITDVTETEEAARTLAAERAMLTEAQRIARLGSWSWDVTTGQSFASAEVGRLLGTPEAFRDPAATLIALVAPEQREAVAERLRLLDETRPPTSEGIWHIIRPDGESRHIHTRSVWTYDADGRRVAGSGTFQDVTEQVEAAHELARQRALLEESQRLARVGSWEWDITTGRIAASDEMKRILGVAPGVSLDGWGFADVVHPEDLETVRAHFRRALATGETVELSHRVVRPDGTTRMAQIRARMVADETGRVVRVVGICQDVTERWELEEHVRQAQKVEALGLLAGSIAHDFNNLLSAIIGGTELARLEVPDESEAAGDLEDVRQAAARAAQLTQQLLAFSRKQTRRPHLLDLCEVLRGSEKLLRRLLPENIALDVAGDGEPVVVRADRAQIEQVLINLVVNARDAIVAGSTDAAEAMAGVVTVEVSRTTLRAGDPRLSRVPGKPLAPGEFGALTVRDTGAGMDEATRARIFEPFFTTKTVGKGTGIGLATVLGIASKAGGVVHVESAPGAGATFTVLLPLVDGAPEGATLGAGALPSGTETILLVEDETIVRETATRILERHGYHVYTARHGGDAVLAWQAHAAEIQLLVTDLRMPEMGGQELIARLRADRPDLRVLVMSGYASGPKEGERALVTRELFLAKPFTTESLLVRVRAALGEGVPEPR